MTESEVETAEVEYDDLLPGSWVVSGTIKPWTSKDIKSTTGRQHATVQEARDELESKGLRVLRDVSQTHIGLWAFRVVKRAHPSVYAAELVPGSVWVRPSGKVLLP